MSIPYREEKPVRPIEHIIAPCGQLNAIVVHNFYTKPGVTFITGEEESLQTGIINYPTGHTIPSHYHPNRIRNINTTQEVIIVKEGRVLVYFYDTSEESTAESYKFNQFATITLEKGDILIQLTGGHGFEILEECILVEVKQGPYNPQTDKIHIKD